MDGATLINELRLAAVWCSSVQRYIDTVRRLRTSPSIHGRDWIEKMVAHYSRRTRNLLKNHPPIARKAAVEFAARLARAEEGKP